VRYGLAGAVFVAIVLASESSLRIGRRHLGVVFSAAVALGVSQVGFVYALDTTSASVIGLILRATLATNLQPFLAAVVAVILLGERINAVQVLGGLLIGIGILAARRRAPVSPGE